MNLRLILLFAVFCYAFNTQAQELWLGGEAGVKLTNRWEVEAEQNLRTRENVTEWRKSLSELGASYEVFQFLELKAKFRHSVLHRKVNEQRVSGDIKLKTDVLKSDWKLSYRFRYQYEWKVDHSNDLAGIRNELELKFGYEKELQPYFSFETFHFLEDADDMKYRLTVGAKMEWIDNFTVNLAYRYQRNIPQFTEFGDEPDQTGIVSIGIGYKFDARKKKK